MACSRCATTHVFKIGLCKKCYTLSGVFHCTFNTCNRPVFAATLCQHHYRRYRVRCLKCNTGVYCRSLCRKHYRRSLTMRRFPREPKCSQCATTAYMDKLCIDHFKAKFDQGCVIVNCNKPSHKRGLCCSHYFKERRAR